MSLTTEKRKMISKNLLELFSSREQEYNGIINEKASTIKDFLEGEDLNQRKMFKDVASKLNNCLLELMYLDNYSLGAHYSCIDWRVFDCGNKIWDGSSIVNIEDSYGLWSLLPNYEANRKQNFVNSSYLFTNLEFSPIEKGIGITDPNIVSSLYSSQVNESSDSRNLKRIYEAFNDLKTAFISGSSFIDNGIDFNVAGEWPPKAEGLTYIPSISFTNSSKVSSNILNILPTVRMTPYPTIGNAIPTRYVVCSTSNSDLKIAKVYSCTEAHPSITEDLLTYYGWTYSVDSIRMLSTLPANSNLEIHRKILSADAINVFNEIKSIYLSSLASFKLLLDGFNELYNSTSDLKTATNNFINYLNNNTLSTATDVNNLFAQATAYNNLFANRKVILLGVLNDAENLSDLNALLAIRLNKMSGSLFSLFRRIEGIDSKYYFYTNGGKKVDFMKTKLIVSKIIEQPTNSYQLTIPENLNEAYAGLSFSNGDTVYILDDTKPELKTKIVKIILGEITDGDNSSVSSSDETTSVKKIKVKFIETDRIIGKDFDKNSYLRIAKDI